MEYIIQHFTKVCVEEFEKARERLFEDKQMSIGEFIVELGKPLQEIQRMVTAQTIEMMDEVYRESSHRKKTHVIERSNELNSFISTCGVIRYSRTYFQVMKDIHSLEIPDFIPPVKSKKKVKVLYINADEDHVSLQFKKVKGDLAKDNNGRKISTLEPRLACIFEGIEKESENSKRNRLVNKHYVAGVYKNSEGIWEEVLRYIDTVYDEEYLEKIYIMGDGAAWIKSGMEVLGVKSCFVLDKFHLNQAIMKAIRHLGDSFDDARNRIYDGISFEKKEDVMKVLDIAMAYAESDNKKEQVRKTRVYIENHWEAIIRPNNDEYARMGCSAEGQVSHILSSRLSSRPLGYVESRKPIQMYGIMILWPVVQGL